ncbi:MAG TPA: PEPxxWA-CTERM sorting domain-containing protein [Sphingomonas sp.]|jgi:hypothetical protein|uniref:PEPxxWA-CTERM sorting domain-containing protein n=1 Tax=Sphingomonas sp. TaxID=28214 RepID=UPI002ED88CB6
MAARGFTLKNEERRRQITIVALAAGIFISTLPVTNERALFSPFADTPLLGAFSPTAYAMFTGYGPAGGNGPLGGLGGPRGVPGRPGAALPPPAAFAARVPPAAAFAAPPAAPPPVANFARPFDGPPPAPVDAFPGPGFGPGDALSTPGGPGPISVVPGNSGPAPAPAVPEPASWAMLLVGFAMTGAFLRRARHALGRRPADPEVSEG